MSQRYVKMVSAFDLGNWNNVCWDCRTSSRIGRLCQHCGKRLVCIGKHPRVPKRKDDAAWLRLRAYIEMLAEWHRSPSRESNARRRRLGLDDVATVHHQGFHTTTYSRKYKRAAQKQMVRRDEY